MNPFRSEGRPSAEDMDQWREHQQFLPPDTTWPAMPRSVGEVFRRTYSRRESFRLAGAVVLAYQATDVAVTESVRSMRTEPEFFTLDTPETPDEFKHHMHILLPGLGVPETSATNMSYIIKPVVEQYGGFTYGRYPDDGLTNRNFRDMATALGELFLHRGITNATFLCHSAGGPNLARLLRAPVENWSTINIGNYGQPEVMENAWEFWKREYGVTFDAVTYFNSPVNGSYIKGAPEQLFAAALGLAPEELLRAGSSLKWLGNLANNHTAGLKNFQRESDRLRAAWRSALDDYSATTWMTEVRTVNRMSVRDYQGVLSPETKVNVCVPSNPANDDVVVTEGLPTAWALVHDRSPSSIGLYEHPEIGHANINDRAEVYKAIIATIYDRQYPKPSAYGDHGYEHI